MSDLGERLSDALHDAADEVEPSPDLYERLNASLDDARERRVFRTKTAGFAAGLVAAVAAVVVATTDYQEGTLIMDWWILELITVGVLIAIAVFLGPFIKRFGKGYAAEVFRSNPTTGKNFIVLTDIAYYMIFAAYILLTMQFTSPDCVRNVCEETVTADQLRLSAQRIGGILLLLGVLHGLNLLILPIIGRLLTLNRQLDVKLSEAKNPE